MELPNNIRVLAIEDESDLRELLQEQLQEAGFEVRTLPDAKDYAAVIKEFTPHVLLVDQSMPGLTGRDVIKKMRENLRFHLTPIIMLTAHAGEDDKIAALELGADDFLGKPYSERELVARIQALVRRSLMTQRSGQERMEIEELVIDLTQQQVFIKQKEIKLTQTEFRLLVELLKNCGEVVSRDRLRERALGHLDVNDRTIDVHILYLRRKLDEMGDRIETVRGLGYRFTILS